MTEVTVMGIRMFYYPVGGCLTQVRLSVINTAQSMLND